MLLNHVLLYVVDVEVALEFYEKELGFRPVKKDLPNYARVAPSEGDAAIGLRRVARKRRLRGTKV